MFTMEKALVHLHTLQTTHPDSVDEAWDTHMKHIIPYRLINYDPRLGTRHGVGLHVTHLEEDDILFRVFHRDSRTVFRFNLKRDGTDNITLMGTASSRPKDKLLCE